MTNLRAVERAKYPLVFHAAGEFRHVPVSPNGIMVAVSPLRISRGEAHTAWLNLEALAPVPSVPDPAANTTVRVRIHTPGRGVPKSWGHIVLAPDCGDYATQRRWKREAWRELARILLADGWKVAAVGRKRLVDWPDGVKSLEGKTSLVRVASLLERARCMISVDSGLAHIAAATGTPTIVLFGPTDPRLCVPLGPQVFMLYSKGLVCRPCQGTARFWSCKARACMDIDPREVVAVVSRFVKR